MKHNNVATNGIRLNVLQEGPKTGKLIILLHGFPEFSFGWRKQIPFLAREGFRVWAPDQRGYNLSDKPSGIASYSIDKLAADVIGLIDAAGEEKATIIGHDWGAAVAWWAAAKYPERIEKLINLNVPHGAVMQNTLRSNRAQLRKSWYIFFFQLPWLPEFFSKLQNWKMATRALTSTSRPGTFTEDDLAQYRQAWSQPKAYRSMINWYRAILQKPPKPAASNRITVPTLLIWGAKDKFLSRAMAQPSIDLCDDGRLEFIEEASHWVQHEEPDRVNQMILSFLRK